MEMMFSQIEAALRGRAYYLAVVATLTIPSICGALAASDGRDPGKDAYTQWLRDNLPSEYNPVALEDIYALRCGILHQARSQRSDMSYSRIVFACVDDLPHLNVVVGTMQLSAGIFCRDVINAARKWLASNATDPNVSKNINDVVQYRPKGFPPIGGLALIA